MTGTPVNLLAKVTCPHCWSSFPPEDILAISESPNLLGDVRLGPHAQERFLPRRFSVTGDPLDSDGIACSQLACPNCHLYVPRPLLETRPLFISVVGCPASGKTYLLASMAWQLRSVLPKFGIQVSDTDTTSNEHLHEYESMLFLNPNGETFVVIEKTEEQGNLYDSVAVDGHAVLYPRPLMFTFQPMAEHPHYAQRDRAARTLCVYDNSGESFRPGKDTTLNPVTRHLAKSDVLFFLFDPTQDARFRQACRGRTHDPQMTADSATQRQDVMFTEMAQRVRRLSSLPDSTKRDKPLIFIVTKYDSWGSLLPRDNLPHCRRGVRDFPYRVFDERCVREVSADVRSLLQRYCPEIVAAAEGFAKEVTYIPISATGCSPDKDPSSGALGFRPANVKPIWAEVPFLYSVAKVCQGLIAVTGRGK